MNIAENAAIVNIIVIIMRIIKFEKVNKSIITLLNNKINRIILITVLIDIVINVDASIKAIIVAVIVSALLKFTIENMYIPLFYLNIIPVFNFNFVSLVCNY